MRLLDLFCGAGGAAMGYYRAGFTDIVGVDIASQPRYPFTFVQADALEYAAEHGQEFDVIHASPPCQAYSVMRNLPWLQHKCYPALILPTLTLLVKLSKLYIIENVMGARRGSKVLTRWGLEAHGLDADYLCGTMFGKPFYRHRLFATNWLWLAPEHPKHILRLHPQMDMKPHCDPFHDTKGRSIIGPGNLGKGAGLSRWQNGAQAEGVGIEHAKGWHLAAEAMDIDWMNRAELTQAIPPAYTEYVGKQLIQQLQVEHMFCT